MAVGAQNTDTLKESKTADIISDIAALNLFKSHVKTSEIPYKKPYKRLMKPEKQRQSLGIHSVVTRQF